jgi:hypothetical protein
MAKDYIEERNQGCYLAGTRVSLDSVVQCFYDGLSPESILSEFDVEPRSDLRGYRLLPGEPGIR